MLDDSGLRKPESVGMPVPVCEVKGVDQAGKEVPTGEVGELWIRRDGRGRGRHSPPRTRRGGGCGVQLTPGSTLTPEALRGHVAARLAAFEVPARIEIRNDPLPRNPSDKILKRELKQALAREAG